jgi:hypothetical protein
MRAAPACLCRVAVWNFYARTAASAFSPSPAPSACTKHRSLNAPSGRPFRRPSLHPDLSPCGLLGKFRGRGVGGQWCSDAVSRVMEHHVVRRMRPPIWTIADRRLAASGLLLAEAHAQVQDLLTVGLGKMRTRRGRRNPVPGGGIQRTIPGDSALAIFASAPSSLISNSIAVVPRFRSVDFSSSAIRAYHLRPGREKVVWIVS